MQPRGARPEEIPAIVALCDTVFRTPPYTTSMGEDFPLLFSPANADDLRIIAEPGGAILSHVGIMRADALIHGIRVPMAGIGAVATRPDRQGQGLATAVLADAFARLAAGGVAVVMISGDRSLYLRAGAAPAGAYLRWLVPPDAAQRLRDPSLRLRPPASVDEMIALHAREPVRRLREPAAFAGRGYAHSIQCRQSTWVVERAGRPAAYWVAGVPDRGRRPRDRVHVIEFGGERDALAGTIAHLLDATGTRRLVLPTQDAAWEALLQGLEPELRPLPGTVAVLRPDVLAQAFGRSVPAGPDLVAAFFGRAGLPRDPALPPPIPLPWPNGLDYV
jgi:predicted N-acetyltransferase YhbS